MRRIFVSCYLMMFLLAGLSVGDEKSPTDSSPKEIAAQIKQIGIDYKTADGKLREKYMAAEAQEKQTILRETRPALQQKYARQFMDIAKQNRNTPQAVNALSQALPLTGRDADLKKQIQDQLIKDHINDKALVPAISGLGRDPEVLKQLIENSESREVRGVASYFQLQMLKGRGLTEANAEEVIPAMDKVRKEYGDVELVSAGGRSAGKLDKLIKDELFAFRNLRIGKEAPDIVGEDLDGVKFKLSDYRGKVVVIDFWGDW